MPFVINFSRYPLVPVIGMSILGLVAGYYVTLPVKWFVLLEIALLVLATGLYFYYREKISSAFIYQFTLWILFFVAGMHYMNLRNPFRVYQNIRGKTSGRPVLLSFRIKKTLTPGKYYDKYTARVLKWDTLPLSFDVLLKISHSKNRENLEPGTIGLYESGSSDWQPLPSPAYPHAFDYGKYLIKRNIFGQIRIKDTSRLHLFRNKQTADLAVRIRDKIRFHWKKYGMDSTALGVASALFLGERQWIEKDIRQAYIDSGIIHVLAISGLHIGILLLFLRLIFGFLRHRIRWLYQLFVIGTLWTFAWLTGFPPSVLRSVLMFSLLQWALENQKKVSPFYILALSAWFILIYDPMFLFDVGFQLSFSAVASILLFMPLMYKIYQPNSKILKYLTDLVYLSIAAQMGVLPLILFYFHRFSFMFILSNILIIPLLTVILGIGFISVLLAVTGIPFALPTELLTRLIHLKVDIIRWLGEFHWAVADRIYFSPLKMTALFILLPGIYLLWKKFTWRRLQRFIISLVLALFFLVIDKQNTLQTRQLILSDTYTGTGLVLQNGDSVLVFTGDSSMFQHVRYDYFSRAGINHIEHLPMYNKFYIGKQKFFMINHDSYYDSITVDILYLTDRPYINLDIVLNKMQPSKVIISKRNSPEMIERWEKTLQKRGVPYEKLDDKSFYRF